MEINAQDHRYSPEIVSKLFHILPASFRITDWQEANQSLVAALQIESNVMFIILSLIIMIAAFNIVSSLMILVKDKNKSIAILRTLGASRYSVISIFVIYGCISGLIGTFMGAVLGIACSHYLDSIRIFLQTITGVKLFDPMIYFLNNLPAKLSAVKVFKIVLMSFSFSFIATIYPAWKISRSSPSSVLRYE